MRDFFAEMLQVLKDEGERAAFDRGVQLLKDIETEEHWLREQSGHINNLGTYLEGTGVGEGFHMVITEDVPKAQRSEYVLEIARKLVQMGFTHFSGDRVLQEITNDGKTLGVQQPIAVIGTVLSNSQEFQRVDRNEYRSIGIQIESNTSINDATRTGQRTVLKITDDPQQHEPSEDEDDLPW